MSPNAENRSFSVVRESYIQHSYPSSVSGGRLLHQKPEDAMCYHLVLKKDNNFSFFYEFTEVSRRLMPQCVEGDSYILGLYDRAS